MNSLLVKLNHHLRTQTLVTKLMYVFIAFFILTFTIRIVSPYLFKQIIDIFALHQLGKDPLFFWKYITYAFIHADVVHLLVNILMLYFFSILFTTFFSEKQLLFVFAFGSIFAGVFYESIAFLNNWSAPVVGASGGITAILLTIASFKPKMEVRLMLIGKIPIIYIGLLLVLIDLLQFPFSNTGGHITHLGGALFGVLFGMYLRFNKFPDFKKKKKKSNLKVVRNTSRKQSFEAVNKQNETQARIDDVLDKISKSGYDSLSKEDKEFLFRQK